MSDLYKINDIILQDENQKQSVNVKSSYKTETNNIVAINIFVKAIQKALDKIHEAIILIAKVKNFDERSAEDLSLLIEFSNNLNLAGKIIDEFQKATAILYDDTPEIISLFKNLNETFSVVRLRISVFAIKKERVYADAIIESLNIILKLFKTMQNTIQETYNT